MTIDLNRLKTMPKDELINLAKQLNAPHHHNNSSETLIENIVNKVMAQTLNSTEKSVEPKVKKEAVFLSESQVEELLIKIKERYKAFSTVYDPDAQCVILKYNDGRYKHSETMSLSCSHTLILTKASNVARGPLILNTLKKEDWGHLGGNTPKNAYTETVLAG